MDTNKKGIYYNPSIHSQKDISVRDARRGFKYLGETYQNDKRGISYRNDGSILFRHESDAYNHMWNNANNLYKVPRNPQGKKLEVSYYLMEVCLCYQIIIMTVERRKFLHTDIK